MSNDAPQILRTEPREGMREITWDFDRFSYTLTEFDKISMSDVLNHQVHETILQLRTGSVGNKIRRPVSRDVRRALLSGTR